jgi:hypothetical protein
MPHSDKTTQRHGGPPLDTPHETTATPLESPRRCPWHQICRQKLVYANRHVIWRNAATRPSSAQRLQREHEYEYMKEVA